MSAFEKLVRGFPGHPIHPPLTDATIGTYTFATIAGVLGVLGLAEDAAAKAMWLALVVGLVVSSVTALTGWVDWFRISSGTPLKRTATTHGLVNAVATVAFAVAAFLQHGGYERGEVSTGALVATLVGFGLLTLGGWLGGSVVYVHGMRVLGMKGEPTARAVSPVPKPEKVAAEGEEGPGTDDDSAPGAPQFDR